MPRLPISLPLSSPTGANIYFFIYDAYGNRDAYREVRGFDNEAQYAALEAAGFEVVHTFSNYTATWPTTLSFFLGEHHYYALSSGVDDFKFGRSVMAGVSPNPVLQALRRNGYRIQYIHHNDYFVITRGMLDFNYPEVRADSALAVFGNPIIDRLIGVAGDEAEKVDNNAQMQVLLANINRLLVKQGSLGSLFRTWRCLPTARRTRHGRNSMAIARSISGAPAKPMRTCRR